MTIGRARFNLYAIPYDIPLIGGSVLELEGYPLGITSMDGGLKSSGAGLAILVASLGIPLLPQEQKVETIRTVMAIVIMPPKNKAGIVLLLLLLEHDDCCCDFDDCCRQTSTCVF